MCSKGSGSWGVLHCWELRDASWPGLEHGWLARGVRRVASQADMNSSARLRVDVDGKLGIDHCGVLGGHRQQVIHASGFLTSRGVLRFGSFRFRSLLPMIGLHMVTGVIPRVPPAL